MDRMEAAMGRFSRQVGTMSRRISGAWSERLQLTAAQKHRNLRTGSVVPDSKLSQFVFSHNFETFGGCVVLFNFLIITMETQAKAVKDDSVLEFTSVANRVLLVYYSAECCVRLYLLKWRFFRGMWNNLDCIIVVTGFISELFEIIQFGGSGMDQISTLKSLRMLRLLRLVRLLVAFRELYVLVAGIGRCMKTLFWASGLIAIVLNVWAILSVEYLDQKVKQLVPTGVFGTCTWCGSAFSTIWHANLTWFQIISTADWTTIGRPLTEEFVWPVAFFILAVFIVMWGLLNLIVAAIVDANMAAREDDVAAAAKLAHRTHYEAFQSFKDMCQAMDENCNGEICISEFENFWRSNDQLKHHLTIMGVEEKDMERLLELMDEDGNGALSYEEFVGEFTQMRTLVEKTTMYFVSKSVQRIQTKLIQQNEIIQNMSKDFAELKTLGSFTVATDASDQRSSGSENQGKNNIKTSATLAKSSVDTFAAAQAHDEGPIAVPYLLTESTQASKSEMPNCKALPSGWYYFGDSLPHEVALWCKPMCPSAESMTTEVFQPEQPSLIKCAGNPPAGALTVPWRQSWEPLPQSNLFVQDSEACVPSSSLGSGVHLVGPCAGDPSAAGGSAPTRHSGTGVHLAGPIAGDPMPPKVFPIDFLSDPHLDLGCDSISAI